MSRTTDLAKHLVKARAGSIDILEAHVWWPLAPKLSDTDYPGRVRVFQIGSAEDARFAADQAVPHKDAGASFAYWRLAPAANLVVELREQAIELLERGFLDVNAEFAKIRQYAALGAESHYMARALSHALSHGEIVMDSTEVWECFGDGVGNGCLT